jgi:2-polyprenyl-6-methoxyphenol hydroxylase-like FAD-dependent oxidoreductase
VVAAHFSNGQKVEADYFIAADGANSISRRLLHPHHPLRHTPIQELVGIAEAPELARQLGPYLQKAQDWDQHLSFGILPCCDEQVIWYMQYHSGINPLPGLTAEEKKHFTETLMKGWPAIVQQAIAATDFERVFCWQTRDMDLLPSFHQGNLVLAGDAAHVALPFTSQGTSSGLSDALLLAELFASGAVEKDAEAAFADYYQRRRADVFTYLQFGRHLEQRFLHPEAFVGMDMPMPLAK